MMKILLANNTLSLLAGTETWTYTLAHQLKKLGHKIQCFSPELGIISQELEREGIKSFNQILASGVRPFSFVFEEEPDHEYDVIIANHWHIVKYLREQFPRTPIISTIHGVIHKLDNGDDAPEHPALDSGVNQFVSVSEEVQEILKKEYSIDSVIIRNFFDTSFFCEKRRISKAPKQILMNSNYNDPNDPDVKIIRDVAKHYGAKFTAIGQNFVQALDTRKAINDSDIVVGMGRSVLEGVCAGRLGIVHGRWGTAGVIHEGSIESIRSKNFSGRDSDGKVMTAQEIIDQIDRFYNRKTIEWGKNYVRREHNVVFAAELFLNLAKELTGQNITRSVDPQLRPYKRQSNVH